MEAILAPEDEIVVTARKRNNTGDPLHVINQQSFAAAQEIDQAVIGPVAVAYANNVPSPIRTGVRNFLKNLREPIVFINFVAQLKPESAARTAGRFALNSTVGVGGLIDIAKRRPFNLPERRNGFANTLGYYGVKPGPYFFLPLFGPTTVRDAIGAVADSSLLITAIGTPFNQPSYSVPASALGAVDRRIAFDEDLQRIREDTGDAYGARRTFYLCRRQAEIDLLRGHRGHTAPTLQFGVRNGAQAPDNADLQCDSLPISAAAYPTDPNEAHLAREVADAGDEALSAPEG
jgi:phospholipid-binding lipoprotein MlaA